MDVAKSKILFHVIRLIFQDTFVLPTAFTQLYKYFIEDSLVQLFREATVQQKQAFFNTCFKPDVSLQNQYFPVETSLFNYETQPVISLMSQFLGLDSDRYVTKSLMSLLFIFSTIQVDSSLSCFLKVDDFIDESIHS